MEPRRPPLACVRVRAYIASVIPLATQPSLQVRISKHTVNDVSVNKQDRWIHSERYSLSMFRTYVRQSAIHLTSKKRQTVPHCGTYSTLTDGKERCTTHEVLQVYRFLTCMILVVLTKWQIGWHPVREKKRWRKIVKCKQRPCDFSFAPVNSIPFLFIW